jgi:hypothetical protein
MKLGIVGGLEPPPERSGIAEASQEGARAFTRREQRRVGDRVAIGAQVERRGERDDPPLGPTRQQRLWVTETVQLYGRALVRQVEPGACLAELLFARGADAPDELENPLAAGPQGEPDRVLGHRNAPEERARRVREGHELRDPPSLAGDPDPESQVPVEDRIGEREVLLRPAGGQLVVPTQERQDLRRQLGRGNRIQPLHVTCQREEELPSSAA